ncbi:MAG: hypothetical protein HQL52_00765 [Magnetococcales bacterium]|nr:hypothetical protein [Magnetococcales bacterium]
MRVTQSLLYRSGSDALQSQYQELRSVEEQTVSGQRLNRPSDDPSAVYRHMMYSADLSSVESLMRTTSFASERLQLGEANIDSIHETLLDAEDLALQYGNSYVEGDPDIMAAASTSALAFFEDILNNLNESLDEIPLFSGGRTIDPYNKVDVEVPDVLLRNNSEGDFVDVSSQYAVTLGEDFASTDIPLSYKIAYQADDGSFDVDVNGVVQEGVAVTENDDGTLTWDLGDGVTLTAQASPETADVLYFQVVPSYQGGQADRAIQSLNGRTLSGNVTADELVNGVGGEQNMFVALSGLRGALLRGDTEEVQAWVEELQTATQQVSDLQGVTGIRTNQVDAVYETLETDEAALTEVQALNTEADLFDLLSSLEQVTQSLEVIASTEREVMNTSLLDFF